MATPPDIENAGTRRAQVMIGPLVPAPLLPNVNEAIERVVVETCTNSPGMFEITFRDDNGLITEEAGVKIGSAVSVSAEGGIAREVPEPIIVGEVTSIEAVCRNLRTKSIVRGYEQSLRMQRIKKTRTFVEMTDSDIAEEIALAAELIPGEIVPTLYVFSHLAQFNQTDWEFLQWRAGEIGYEAGVSNGIFFFRPSTGTAEGAAMDDPEALAHPAVPLRFKENLISFMPTVNATGLTQTVEVRTWDPGLKTALISTPLPVESTTAIIAENPVEMATQEFGEELPTLPVMSDSILNPAELTVPVDPEAYLVYDRPVDTGPTAEAAVDQYAVALADQRGSTFAEAEGYAIGDPNLQAGDPVEVLAVPVRFAGLWQVTRARHIFDDAIGGYYTRFWVTGRQNRSLLGLTSGKAAEPPRVNGFVCGIVTNNFDTGLPPKGRVKLAFPWLSPDYESDWAPVIQAGAGNTTGALFMPQVDDQVLVGFEFGDVRRPYVLGGVPSDLSEEFLSLGLGAPPVEDELGNVVRRGIVSPSGMNLTFTDMGPPDVPPEMSEVSVGSFENTMALQINQTAGTIALNCFPVPGEESDSPEGNILISVGEAGNIAITSGGTIDLTAEEAINFSAPSVNFAVEGEMSIEAVGTVTVEAPIISLNSP